MKHLVALAGLILMAVLQGPVMASEFQDLKQKTQTLLPQADSIQELERLTHWMLELYLWSKDSFDLRQSPELWPSLQSWPELMQQRRRALSQLPRIQAEASLRGLEAAYALLIHDFAAARTLAAELPPGPYPALLQALLGEQDPENPGVWRIPLEQARSLVRRYPQQPLAQLVLAEALLERIQAPGADPALLREAQWAAQQALRHQPASHYAHYQLGQVLYLQQRQDEAFQYFDRQVAPDGAVAAESVGNFYLWMEDPEQALHFYERARRFEPATLRLYQKLEQVYLQTRPGEAVRLYLRGLAQAPDSAALYLRLQGLYEQASPEQIRQWLAAELPATGYLSWLIQGDLALREGDARSATHWYQKALGLEPRRIEAYHSLLSLHWSRRETEPMARLLAQADSHKLVNPDLSYWRSVLALQQGQLETAIALLEPLARDDTRARYTLAMAYRQKRDFARARELMLSLIEQDPQNVALILALGDLFLASDSLAEAEAIYQQALRLEPYNAAVYFSLGNLYSESRNFEAAVEAFERAILIQPDEFDFRNNLGNVYIRQNRLDAARSQFEAIVERHPDYAGAYYNLACVYALSQQKDQALYHLQRAISLDQSLKQTAREDQDLAGLRSDRRFQELID